jgi:DNA invertase Pin-like site-specific DNA recombinase
MPRHSTSPVAYSYIRFSTGEQRRGDSLRRQEQLAEDYCRRKGWALSRETYRDLGVSAFKGKNALVGNLGEFLRAITEGGVKAGSVLIVESFDRITRQGIDEGYDLIKGILKADIRIVTLSPEREFDREATRSLSKGALEIQLILERAAEESERKAARLAAAWSEKKRRVRAGEAQVATERMGVGCRVMTRRLPAWVEKVDGELRLVPEAAAAVRQVFQLAAAGYGVPTIIQKLTRDGVPPIGRTDRWTRSYVAILLKDGRVRGIYQPKKGKDKDGEAIAYYPAAIDEGLWLAARAGVKQRTRYPRRTSERQVNIFSGLMKHARDGDTYVMTGRLSISPTKPTTQFHALVNSLGSDGVARQYSIPYLPFEAAVLSCLREIDPGEVVPGEGRQDNTKALEGRLKELEGEIAKVKARVQAKYSDALADVLDRHAEEYKLVKEQLAEAEEQAATPLSRSWEECFTLLDALNAAEDKHDARLRIRSALRRITEDIRLLIVPRGRARLCAVQMQFKGGQRRAYLVYYRSAQRPGGKPIPAELRRCSLNDVVALGAIDLRDRGHAARLEKALEAVPVDRLLSLMKKLVVE